MIIAALFAWALALAFVNAGAIVPALLALIVSVALTAIWWKLSRPFEMED